ncbi:MAG: single-stranded DNA-binding protein [Armatimonadetes bacterium]|nr:single-stranded DNA-binding protein [Armatimonadota bacterium]
MMNQVQLIGRLEKDPELRTLGSGRQVASFPLQVPRKTVMVGSKSNHDTFLIEAFGQTAHYTMEEIVRGRLIAVTGHLATKPMKNSDGVEFEAVYVAANTVCLLDRPTNA